jgi:hypothetical protein
MSAHNTIIQFLHENRNWKLIIKLSRPGLWFIALNYPSGIMWLCASGDSYEAACAGITQQFPKNR